MKRIKYVLLLCIMMLFCLTSCVKTELHGVQSAVINELGELIITYSNGEVQNVGKVVGENGTDVNGNSIIIEDQGDSIEYATALGLTSSVSIICNFTKNTDNSYGGIIPGYGSNTSTKEYSSAGSGVIYKLNKALGEAFIITNYHVVYDADCNTENGISDDINVYLYGSMTSSQAISATYVGGSLNYDIAVLYVENSDIIKNSFVNPINVADSDKVCVGDTAIAIGNPRGMGTAASSGIVSVDSEYINMTAADEMTAVSFRVMRIDTAVNSGNSGGGLFNNKGELIGIVNAKIISSNVENIAYAIPSNLAIAVANNIIDHCFKTEVETVLRPIIGLTVTTKSSYASFNPETGKVSIKENIEVYDVTPDSVADGLFEVGDIILSISSNGLTKEVTRQFNVIDFMLNIRANTDVTIQVNRNGEIKDITFRITEQNLVAY